MPPSCKRGLASQTKDLSIEIPFIFLFSRKRKMWNDADGSRGIGLQFADGGRNALAVRRGGAAANCAVRRTAISPASAYPAAEAISDKGRPRRRSVKNRKSFDCFKSAEGIRFSAVARPTPKSFHRGTFWLHLLGDKRWKSCIKLFAVQKSVRKHGKYVFGQQPAGNADERKVSCGPPRGRGCGPRDSDESQA